VHRAGIEPATQ